MSPIPVISKDKKMNKIQQDLHVSAIAGFLFLIFLLIGALGGTLMANKGFLN